MPKFDRKNFCVLFFFIIFQSEIYSAPAIYVPIDIDSSAAGIRVFKDSTKSRTSVLTLNQVGKAEIHFASYDYTWAAKSIDYLKSHLDEEHLGLAFAAAALTPPKDEVRQIVASVKSDLTSPLEKFKSIKDCLPAFRNLIARPKIEGLHPAITRFFTYKTHSQVFSNLPSGLHVNPKPKYQIGSDNSMGWTTPLPPNLTDQLPAWTKTDSIGWTDPVENPDNLHGGKTPKKDPMGWTDPIEPGFEFEQTCNSPEESDPIPDVNKDPTPLVLAGPGSSAGPIAPSMNPCKIPDEVQSLWDASSLHKAKNRFDIWDIYTGACQRNLIPVRGGADRKDITQLIHSFLFTLSTLPNRIMNIETLTVTYNISMTPSSVQLEKISQLGLPENYELPEINLVYGVDINRPFDLKIDSQLGTRAEKIGDSIKVDVPYTFYGTLGLLDDSSTKYKFAVADISAISADRFWDFRSLGLSLKFDIADLKKPQL